MRIGLDTISEETLRQIVSDSVSIREALIRVGVQPYGANYQTFRNKCRLFGIDSSHFLGLAARRRAKRQWTTGEIPLERILVSDSSYTNTNKLRKRLIKAGVFEHKCYKCGLSKWMGFPIPIELEHKNGDRRDHRLENLTILCPNCHALTPTYRGRNIRAREETGKAFPT